MAAWVWVREPEMLQWPPVFPHCRDPAVWWPVALQSVMQCLRMAVTAGAWEPTVSWALERMRTCGHQILLSPNKWREERFCPPLVEVSILSFWPETKIDYFLDILLLYLKFVI